MCCKTFEDSRSGRVQHNMAMNQRLLIRPGFFFFNMYLDVRGRAEQVQLLKANKTTLIPACSVHQLFSTGPLHLPPSVSSTLSPAPAISLALALTDTARRAGLPVVSIFHLDAGDSALPLQFITWITRKGHRVARLPTFPIATAIHRNAGISAGCSQ